MAQRPRKRIIWKARDNDGRIFKCLLDSGAETSVISDARKLSIAAAPPISLVMADGSAQMVNRCSTVNITLPTKQGSLPLTLTAYLGQLQSKVDIVLGMDFLQATNPQIDWPQRSVRIQTDDPSTTTPKTEETPTMARNDQTNPTDGASATTTTSSTNIHDLLTFDPDELIEMRSRRMKKWLAKQEREGHEVNMMLLRLSEPRPPPNAKTGSSRPLPEVPAHLARAYHSAVDTLTGVTHDELDPITDIHIREILQGFSDLFEEPQRTDHILQNTGVQHTITLVPGAKPRSFAPYRMSHHELQELGKRISALLAAGHIEHAASPWGAPVLFAKRAGSDKLRLCVDYRHLNAQTKPDGYAIPSQEDLMHRAAQATCWTSLDLAQAFHAVPMDTESMEMTAFNTQFGSYLWRSMPFGLRNASATQQRLMTTIFSDLLAEQKMLIYLDDIVLLGDKDDMEAHYQLVAEVLRRLQTNGLRLRAHKCKFAVSEIKFLGHIIKHNHIEIDPDKISAVRKWPVPRTRKQVQRFLGLAGYLRRYVSGFSELAQPLHAIVNKFAWGPQQEAAFEGIKAALTSAPTLATPNPDLAYHVHTDASNTAIGAAILQDGRPICYLSKLLQGAQLNYDVRSKEMLAVVTAFTRNRHLFAGHPNVVVYTDHESLLRLPLPDNHLNPRLARWQEKLAEYNIKWVYRRGQQHHLPDALSRRHLAASEATDPNDAHQPQRQGKVLLNENWTTDYQADPYFAECYNALASSATAALGPKMRERSRFWTRENDKVYVQYPGHERRLAVPRHHQRRIMQLHHGTAMTGHPGTTTTARAISREFFWPRLSGSVSKFIANCDACLRSKAQRHHPGIVRPLAPPTGRWQRLQVDFITGLPISHGYNAICTFICTFTRRLHLAPCRTDITAEQFAQLYLDTIVRHHGVVPAMLMDRDSKFTATFWQQLSIRLGIDTTYATTDHHQTMGTVERANQTATEALRTLVHTKPNDWALFLSTVEFSLNSTHHTTINTTPFEADYGYAVPQLASINNTQPRLEDHAQRQRDDIHLIDDAMAHARQITADNAKHRFDQQLQPGDLVLVKAERLSTDAERQDSSKLHAKYRGPYKVTKRLEFDNYELALPPTTRAHNVFHISNLRKYTATNHPDAELPEGNDDMYLVEKIVGHKTTRNGSIKYQVKWKGYNRSHNTFEHLNNLANVIDLVQQYCKNNGLPSPQR